jgi:integrase/recombinase XerC
LVLAVFFMEQLKQKYFDYLRLEKNYSEHTLLAYGDDLSFFEAFLKGAYEDADLVRVVYPQVRAWIVSLSDDGISNSSINRKISSLRSFYKFLLKTKVILVSPLLKHKALKSPKKLQIPFSEKELDLVLNSLKFSDDFDGIRDKLVIDMFYTTGIRRAELIGLKVQDVDLNGGTIKVLGKRNKERIIPLLPVVMDEIKKYLTERAHIQTIRDEDSFFLLSKGVKLTDSFVYRIINYYFSSVSEKVKKSPHILRHTFATHLLNHGADINSVKELLGHSSLASTQVYTHSSLAELKKVYGSAHPRNKE